MTAFDPDKRMTAKETLKALAVLAREEEVT